MVVLPIVGGGVISKTSTMCFFASRSSETKTSPTTPSSSSSHSSKEVLFDLILNQTPPGQATSTVVTRQILQQIQSMSCPTPDQAIIPALAGSWELLWTAQDPSQPESQRWNNRILNPIENQSFSNNPEGGGSDSNSRGRSNPFLPMGVQNVLEQWGVVDPSTTTTRRSTQVIDIKTRTIRNIVSIQLNTKQQQQQQQQRHPTSLLAPFFRKASISSSSSSSPTPPRRISLTVTVKFTPVQSDPRRVNVKFTECRISIPFSWASSLFSLSSSKDTKSPKQNNWEYTFPLGLLGPTGWLRTIYIDDTLRITRGHKGSVFVLTRPRRATV
jgi:hypothetical protein